MNLFNEEELRYRLVPQWRTAGELFHHIGGHQYFVARDVLKRQWEPKPSEPDMDWADHILRTTTTTESLSYMVTAHPRMDYLDMSRRTRQISRSM